MTTREPPHGFISFAELGRIGDMADEAEGRVRAEFEAAAAKKIPGMCQRIRELLIVAAKQGTPRPETKDFPFGNGHEFALFVSRRLNVLDPAFQAEVIPSETPRGPKGWSVRVRIPPRTEKNPTGENKADENSPP